MASMQVEGKMPVEVPQHLAGVVAAGTQSRLMYKVLDSLIFGIPYSLSVMTTLAVAQGDIGSGGAGFASVMMFGAICLTLVNYILLLVKGQTLGMKAMGLRWVSFQDGSVRPGSNFLKNLLEGLLGPIFFILAFASQDESGRHFADRAANIITINTKLGRDSSTTPAPLVDDSVPHVPQPWNSSSGDPLFAPDGSPLAASEPSGVIGEVPQFPAPSAADAVPASPWGAAPPAPAVELSPFAPPVTEVPAPAPAASASFAPPEPGAAVPAAAPVPAPPAPAVESSPFAPPVTEVPAAGSAVPASFAPPAPVEPVTPPAPAPSSFAPPVSSVPSATPSVAAQDEDLDRTIARRPVDSILLTFDDGTHHFLVGQALLGRAPEPEPAHPEAQMLPIHDPGRSISKVHLALTVQSGAVLVEDMHSMNGTTVILPSGTAQAVLPGAPVLAAAGSTVYFGERSVKIGG